jgi:hypothetical protein
MAMFAAPHESACGTFRTLRDVRLASGMRTKVDVGRPSNLWVHALGNALEIRRRSRTPGVGSRRSPRRHVNRLGTSLSSADLPDGLGARMDRPFGTKVLVEKPLRAKTDFPSQRDPGWRSGRTKYSALQFGKSEIHPSPSRPTQRGVSRTSRTRGGLRWTEWHERSL